MRGRQLRTVLVIFALMALMTTQLTAQAVSSAQIHGAITDPTGRAIAGAQVKAIQIDTGMVRSTVSNTEGAFSLPNLPVGPYKLEVTASGFQNYIQTGMTLQVSQNPKVDIRLQLGTVSVVEEVRGDAIMVNTNETSVSQVIDQQRVVDLPLDGRQATDLILLSGGASSTVIPGNDLLSSKNYGNGNVTGSVTATISVAGGQQNSNNYLLDGGDHVDKFSNLNMPFPFPDAIQEFSVQTSTLSARYGEHAGSVVNVVTKSGGNHFHGDIFEFIRNDAVNAHHWMAPGGTSNPNDNALRRNQFGGTLGGPIVRDKLQFFLGYQGTRNFQMQAPTQVIVPTAAALAGDFSTMLSATCLKQTQARAIKDPVNGQPFANAQVPTGRFNQQAMNILKLIPVSSNPCGTRSLSIPNTGDENQGISRIDWVQSPRNTVFGRYFITDFTDPPIFDGANLLTTTKAGQLARNQSLVLGDTFTITSSLVNSLHVTANRMAIFRGPADNVPNPAALGINVPSPVANDLVVSVSSYFNVESGTATAGHFNNNSLHVAEDMDWTKGKHQFAFGFDYIHSQLNELSTFQSDGQFAFSGASGLGSSGDALVDFMLGATSSFAQGNNEQENWRQSYYGLYAQDSYRVRPNLTLNFGVRWEPYFPAADRYHRGSHFDPAAFAVGTVSKVFPTAPPGLFYCGDAQTSCAYVNSHWANFSPRVGFNWDPRGKGNETIRAGYGLFYDNPEEFYFDRFADNSPFGSGISLSRPAGGLTNPYQGQTVPPFPLAFPTASNAFFPKNGVYINVPLNLRPTYVQQWNLAIDKQFGSSWLVSATYFGNRTNHIWLGYDANAPAFIAGNDCGSSSTAKPTHGAGTSPCSTTGNEQVRRLLSLQSPTAGSFFSSVSTTTDDGNASYNGLLLSMNHRFNHNFTLLTNYTYSHCISLGDFGGELSSSRLITNPRNLAGDRGNCSFDIRHIFNSSLVAASPRFSSGWARTFLSDWQLSTIMGYRTGNHFSALTGTDTSLTGIKQDRADLVGDPTSGSCSLAGGGTAPVGSPLCWFNTSAFVTGAAGTFGTST
ncbi:MAG TPA: TonB-dependent receptor, partial [Candidatus Sulfotelmatobacter sp.]|nr:TonB-dependent receptor [Candidatus Sulfotelmatobacter sp.]